MKSAASAKIAGVFTLGLAAVLAVALVSGCGGRQGPGASSGEAEHALIGATAPAFELPAQSGGGKVALDDKVGKDCTLGGKKLYGKVKVVDAFPDFEVKRVDAFADLHVKVVDAFPDSCGRWKYVDAFPDFTIKWVDAFPDFTIKQVDAFPGVP